MAAANAIMVGEAFIPITADDSPIQKSMNRTRSRVRGFVRGVGKSFKKIGRAINAAFGVLLKVGKALAIVGTAGAIALGATIKSFAAFGDRLAKTADKLGISIVALNELRFAAERSGVEIRTFDMGLQRFIRRAAEAARGTGEAKDALEQLGIQLVDNEGNLRPAEDLLGDVADAFVGLESQAERVRIAFKLFDSEGVAFVNILAQGSKGIQELRKESRRLNPVTAEQARLAEEITDRFTDFTTAIRGVSVVIGSQFGPAAVRVLEIVTELIVSLRKWIESFDDVSISVLRVEANIRKFGIVFSDVISNTVPGLKRFAIAIKTAMGTAITEITKFNIQWEKTLAIFGPITLSDEAKKQLAAIDTELQRRIAKIRGARGAAPGVTRPGPRPGGGAPQVTGGFGTFATRLLNQVLPTQMRNPLVRLSERQITVLQQIRDGIQKMAAIVGLPTRTELNRIASLVAQSRILPQGTGAPLRRQLLGQQEQFAASGFQGGASAREAARQQLELLRQIARNTTITGVIKP